MKFVVAFVFMAVTAFASAHSTNISIVANTPVVDPAQIADQIFRIVKTSRTALLGPLTQLVKFIESFAVAARDLPKPYDGVFIPIANQLQNSSQQFYKSVNLALDKEFTCLTTIVGQVAKTEANVSAILLEMASTVPTGAEANATTVVVPASPSNTTTVG